MSAGSEAGNLRAYLLADSILQKPWRSLTTSTYFLSIFAEPSPIDLLGLFGTNIGPTDQVRHRLYDESNAVLLDVTADAGVASGFGMHIYRLASTVVASRWRCDIAATSRSSFGTFDIGRAWAGPLWKPSRGISPGWTNGLVDKTEKSRGRYSGAVFVGKGPQYRSADFALDWMSEADSDTAKKMVRDVGVRSQVFFAPFDENLTTLAILGKFTAISAVTERNSFPKTASQKFTIEQDL
jgi:hypothetical protein